MNPPPEFFFFIHFSYFPISARRWFYRSRSMDYSDVSIKTSTVVIYSSTSWRQRIASRQTAPVSSNIFGGKRREPGRARHSRWAALTGTPQRSDSAGNVCRSNALAYCEERFVASALRPLPAKIWRKWKFFFCFSMKRWKKKKKNWKTENFFKFGGGGRGSCASWG